MLINNLQKLDIPKNSIIVFQFLLQNGEQKAIPITHATGLYKQSVYSALDDLEYRGMIKKIMKNGVAHYRVLSVEPLMKDAEERYQAACEIRRIVKKTIKKPESSIAFYEGIEGVHDFTQFVLEYARPLNILGANISFRQFYPEIFDTWLVQWNRKKISLRR